MVRLEAEHFLRLPVSMTAFPGCSCSSQARVGELDHTRWTDIELSGATWFMLKKTAKPLTEQPAPAARQSKQKSGCALLIEIQERPCRLLQQVKRRGRRCLTRADVWTDAAPVSAMQVARRSPASGRR